MSSTATAAAAGDCKDKISSFLSSHFENDYSDDDDDDDDDDDYSDESDDEVYRQQQIDISRLTHLMKVKEEAFALLVGDFSKLESDTKNELMMMSEKHKISLDTLRRQLLIEKLDKKHLQKEIEASINLKEFEISRLIDEVRKVRRKVSSDRNLFENELGLMEKELQASITVKKVLVEENNSLRIRAESKNDEEIALVKKKMTRELKKLAWKNRVLLKEFMDINHSKDLQIVSLMTAVNESQQTIVDDSVKMRKYDQSWIEKLKMKDAGVDVLVNENTQLQRKLEKAIKNQNDAEDQIVIIKSEVHRRDKFYRLVLEKKEFEILTAQEKNENERMRKSELEILTQIELKKKIEEVKIKIIIIIFFR
jgi:hypothetical protein